MTVRQNTLSSSWLSSCEYDDETRTLTITTVRGESYDHHNVPEEVYQGLVEAASPGKYWHMEIKDIYT